MTKLAAVIERLRALNEPCEVEIETDSRGMSEYLAVWKANGWRKSGGDPVTNRELWEELDSLAWDHDTQ